MSAAPTLTSFAAPRGGGEPDRETRIRFAPLRSGLFAALLALSSIAAAREPPSAASRVIGSVQRGADAAASGVKRGLKAAASGVERGGRYVASGVQRGARATEQAVGTAARKVGITPAASQPAK